MALIRAAMKYETPGLTLEEAIQGLLHQALIAQGYVILEVADQDLRFLGWRVGEVADFEMGGQCHFSEYVDQIEKLVGVLAYPLSRESRTYYKFRPIADPYRISETPIRAIEL